MRVVHAINEPRRLWNLMPFSPSYDLIWSYYDNVYLSKTNAACKQQNTRMTLSERITWRELHSFGSLSTRHIQERLLKKLTQRNYQRNCRSKTLKANSQRVALEVTVEEENISVGFQESFLKHSNFLLEIIFRFPENAPVGCFDLIGSSFPSLLSNCKHSSLWSSIT